MSNKITAFALLAVSLAGIFCPDIGPPSRFLMVEEKTEANKRGLEATTTSRTPPPGMGLSCPTGQEVFAIDWTEVAYSARKANQTVTFANGMSAIISIKDTGAARASGWKKDANGYITFTVRTTCDASHIITPNASVYPDYPDDYSTMELNFDRELHGLYISISNVDSGPTDADAVRIRFYDAAHEAVAAVFSTTGFVHFHEDYGFATEENLSVDNPDFDASLFAKAYGGVKTIALDQSLFCFAPSGDIAERTIYPALDFAFCVPSLEPTPEQGPASAVAIDHEPTTGVVVADPLSSTPEQGPASAVEIDPEPRAGVAIADPLSSTPEQGPASAVAIDPEPRAGVVVADPLSSTPEQGPASAVAIDPEPRAGVVVADPLSSTPEQGPASADAIDPESTTGVVVADPLSETVLESLPETVPESLPETVHESLPETLPENLAGTDSEPLNVTDSEPLNATVPEPLNATAPETLPLTENETPAPAFTAGVIGDSLIMGLSGQMFKFSGRSGAWYSAISSRPFQWNMKIQQYESCPSDPVNFVSAVGLTFTKGSKKRRIEISVSNAYNHVVGGDYTFKDGTGRIVAFNTFYHCSRKWYDFDVRPPVVSETSLRSGRRLDQPNVFDVIDGLKKTMMDEQACDHWLFERKLYGDLFIQPGRFSTIIVETADITLHIEYKQESERCDAHSIDVWISSVSPSLLEETWEGVIGETKNPAFEANLKFADEADYEVKSPFDNKCKGCVN
ncbi:hypothetical protein MHU86_25559 [Fragilaria crotonensis]|nr:hypothetical protein MHU86_25559 [Fragilaria crotonensis]